MNEDYVNNETDDNELEEERNYHEGNTFDDASQDASLSPEDDLPEVEEESQEAKEEKSRKREQDRISKLKNKKYFLLEQNQKLLRENEKLRKEKEEAIETGLYEFGKNAINELEEAKYRKKRALEEADSELLIEADIDIFKAQQKIDELDRTVNYQPKETYQEEESVDHLKQEKINDWISEHPEINPRDPQYNPHKEKVVSDFVLHLNQKLEEDGAADNIGTPSYLDFVSEFVRDLDKPDQASNMKTSKPSRTAPVSGVRNQPSSSSSGSVRYPQVTLNRDERMAARGLGMTDAEYLKDKIHVMRRNGEL